LVIVNTDFQGTGIGSALLSACFDDATRINATISIVKSVLGAEEFYCRHGFLIVGPGSTSKRGVIIPDTRMHRWYRPPSDHLARLLGFFSNEFS
jgi:predicted N-acetyltransferase YhbS